MNNLLVKFFECVDDKFLTANCYGKEMKQVPFDTIRNRVNESFLNEIDSQFMKISNNIWIKNIDKGIFQVFEILLEKGVRFCYFKYGVGFYDIPISKDFNEFHKIDFKKFGIEYHIARNSVTGSRPRSGIDGLEFMCDIEEFEKSLEKFFVWNKKS